MRKLLGMGFMAAALALAAACGGEEEPAAPGGAGGGAGAGGDQPRVEAGASAGTQAPLPTRPQRIEDRLLTPTAAPEPVEEPETTQGSGTGPGATTPPQESTGPTVGPGGIAGLVPADPRFTDEVLLQDIYARIDLDQFALDPEEPIEFGDWRSTMEYPLVHKHPFLHLFPSIQEAVGAQERPSNLWYGPTGRDRFNSISASMNGLINFIYNPWFHPIQPGPQNQVARSHVSNFNLHRSIYSSQRTKAPPDYQFGDNSTKGVLLETVAKLVEEAQLPGVEPAQRAWWKEDALRGNWQDRNALELRDWTLEEFLSISVNGEHVNAGAKELSGINYHITPQVEWEILHPQLPIVRVTVHAEQKLPLQRTPQLKMPEPVDKLTDDQRFAVTKARGFDGKYRGLTQAEAEAKYIKSLDAFLREKVLREYYAKKTRYSVSFVMSFQNRWESFDDPNRWLIRFKDDLDLYLAPPWKLEEDLPYPNYWDDTDYMQHRIIGPVVMTVHESTVHQPGNHSMTPRITEWEAPGHILTDRQVPTATRELILGGYHFTLRRGDEQGFRQWPVLPGINAGFPLPGHILVTPSYGPGSDLWREKGMDGNDW